MSKWVLRGLWILAAFVALGLLAVTIALGAQASDRAAQEKKVYLAGLSKVVVLREEPDQMSSVAGVIERGTAVELLDSKIEGGQAWYQVRTDVVSGWVRADDVSLSPP